MLYTNSPLPASFCVSQCYCQAIWNGKINYGKNSTTCFVLITTGTHRLCPSDVLAVFLKMTCLFSKDIDNISWRVIPLLSSFSFRQFFCHTMPITSILTLKKDFKRLDYLSSGTLPLQTDFIRPFRTQNQKMISYWKSQAKENIIWIYKRYHYLNNEKSYPTINAKVSCADNLFMRT